MFCRKCGKEIPDDSEFCYKCGTPVIEVDQRSKPSDSTVRFEKAKIRRCLKCGKTITSQIILCCPYCSGELTSVVNCDEDENASNSSSLVKPFDAHEKAQEAFQRECQKVLAENRVKDANTPVALVNLVSVFKIICIAALILGLFFEFIIAENISINSIDDINNHNMVIIFSYFFYAIFFCGLAVRIICALIICSKRGEMGGVGAFLGIGLVITFILGVIIKNWFGVFVLYGIIAVSYVGHKISDYM